MQFYRPSHTHHQWDSQAQGGHKQNSPLPGTRREFLENLMSHFGLCHRISSIARNRTGRTTVLAASHRVLDRAEKAEQPDDGRLILSFGGDFQPQAAERQRELTSASSEQGNFPECADAESVSYGKFLESLVN
jgi:hypothetical protein